MNNYTVYIHRNLINNKIYVGVTCQPIKKRWKDGKGYKSKAFSEEIKQYGWGSFDHIVLYENLSEKEALEKEQELVAFFESNNPEKGYNKTKGGDAGKMLGKTQSTQTREKISLSRKTKGFTDTHKKHISDSKKGINHHFAKKVYQYTKDGKFIREWEYMSEASKTLNISKGNIGEVCNGHRKTAGGYIWRYERV